MLVQLKYLLECGGVLLSSVLQHEGHLVACCIAVAAPLQMLSRCMMAGCFCVPFWKFICRGG